MRKSISRDKTHLEFLPFLLLGALILINYAGTLGADFVYDDQTQLVENIALRDLRNIPRFFTDPAHTSDASVFEEIYRPLRATCFALEYSIWGLNPSGYHAVNLLFHGLNTFLVFLLLSHLFRARLPSLAGALVFASHPALTESVCWVSGRSDLLCMFFYLSALLWYLKARDAQGGRRAALLCGAVTATVFALLAKEMAVTFIFVPAAIDFWLTDNKRQSPRRWLAYLPFLGVTAAYMLFRATIMGRFAQRAPWSGSVFGVGVIMAKGFSYYIRLLLFPFKLTVVPHVSPSTSLDAGTIWPIALPACLIAAAFAARRRYPLPSLGIILFFILLLPVSNIIPIKTIVADRFVYLPSLGYVLAFAGVFSLFDLLKVNLPAAKAMACGALVCVVLFFSLNTITRSVDWHDNETLLMAAVEVEPENPRANVMLGKQYFLSGDNDSALRHCLISIRSDPGGSEGHTLLSSIYLKQRRYREAQLEAEKAIELDPSVSDAYNTLGLIHLAQGNINKALAAFEAGRKITPYSPEILNNLGALYIRMDDFQRAAEYFVETLKVNPKNFDAVYNLALAYAELKKYSEAAELLQNLLAKDPNDFDSIMLLAKALAGKGDRRGAIGAYTRAIQTRPSDAFAPAALADLLAEDGEYEKAVSLYRSILARYPASIAQRISLAKALDKTGQLDAAIEQLRTATLLSPNNATAHNELARMLEKAGRRSEAEREYRRGEDISRNRAEKGKEGVPEQRSQ